LTLHRKKVQETDCKAQLERDKRKGERWKEKERMTANDVVACRALRQSCSQLCIYIARVATIAATAAAKLNDFVRVNLGTLLINVHIAYVSTRVLACASVC